MRGCGVAGEFFWERKPGGSGEGRLLLSSSVLLQDK